MHAVRPLGLPAALGAPPVVSAPQPTQPRRFVVPGAARRGILPSRPRVEPARAEARPATAE